MSIFNIQIWINAYVKIQIIDSTEIYQSSSIIGWSIVEPLIYLIYKEELILQEVGLKVRNGNGLDDSSTKEKAEPLFQYLVYQYLWWMGNGRVWHP